MRGPLRDGNASLVIPGRGEGANPEFHEIPGLVLRTITGMTSNLPTRPPSMAPEGEDRPFPAVFAVLTGALRAAESPVPLYYVASPIRL